MTEPSPAGIVTRRTLIVAGLAALTATSTPPAMAAEAIFPAFDQARFDQAQYEGQGIVLLFRASWCATCALQTPILESVAAAPAFHNVLFLDIDYDARRDLVRKFRIYAQATILVFKGFGEMGRIVGDVEPGAIQALLDKAL